MEKYRINEATGECYKWSEKADAYVFCGNLNNRTKKQFIRDQENREAFGEHLNEGE